MRRTLLNALIAISLGICHTAVGQQHTVGILTYDPGSTFEGYTLLFPTGQGTVFLIDNCGRIVHEWPDTTLFPGNAVYLAENGDMYRAARNMVNLNNTITGGGQGQYLQRKDWNNNILWEFEYNDSLRRMHHDIHVLPNGNVFIIAWEWKSMAEAVQMGRDTTGISATALWPDHVIEVQQTGLNTASIVWEWHIWDHLIQDHDSTKANYGVVADHPELLDINLNPSNSADWLHVNSIDYNEDLDQILLSSPFINEIFVIDHSTTTQEAASHAGGNSGHGGDLLYRWGSPANYGAGTVADQQFIFQHNAHWMDVGLDTNHADHGNIMVFNNRVNNDHSTVNIIEPPVDASGNYSLAQGMAYSPSTSSWIYVAPTPTDLYSSGLGSAQRLPNGNTLICSGRQGWIFEIGPTGNVVWEYENPIFNGSPWIQGDPITSPGNFIFMATRYATDYGAFQGVTLSPIGYIELQPDTVFCSIILALDENGGTGINGLFPNPATDRITVSYSITGPANYVILDLVGRSVLQGTLNTDREEIPLNGIATGTYILRVAGHGSQRFLVE